MCWTNGDYTTLCFPGPRHRLDCHSLGAGLQIFTKKTECLFLINEIAGHNQQQHGPTTPPLLPALSHRKTVSISTIFVAVFLIFVTSLGSSLITVSILFSSDSFALLNQGTNVAQQIYLNLVQNSNLQLINASNYSVD